MIWGGQRLRTLFNFAIPSDQTGEAWVVSAHADGDTHVVTDYDEKMSLNQLYREHRALFGPGSNIEFPLLVKIIDANKDLSIQVHPNNDYARAHEGSLGKSECWLVLDCEPTTKLILGHHAHDTLTFTEKLMNHEFSTLFREVEIHKDDFFYVPAGTMHAICEGTLIYEIQQNSAITYRIYDYDRLDVQGNPRTLHIKQALDVLTCPSQPTAISPSCVVHPSQHILLDNDFFKIQKINIQGELRIQLSDVFMIVGVLEGEGSLNGNTLMKGDHYIVLPKEEHMHFIGELTIIVIEPSLATIM